MEQELNIAYDQKLTREVWQRVAQSLPPLEASAADTGSCGITAPPPEDSTHRLQRFIDEELSLARAYRRQVRCAPPSARRTLMRLSDEELAHARTLLAAHYLLTGRYYRPPTPVGAEPRSSWCRLLRELYREETCGGWAYAQAAEDTEDVCLRDIFRRFSQAEYGHAASLLHLLESSLTTGNNLLK